MARILRRSGRTSTGSRSTSASGAGRSARASSIRCSTSPRSASGSARSSTRPQNAPGGVPYLDFIAPGLFAAAAMQTAAGEASMAGDGRDALDARLPRAGGHAVCGSATSSPATSSLVLSRVAMTTNDAADWAVITAFGAVSCRRALLALTGRRPARGRLLDPDGRVGGARRGRPHVRDDLPLPHRADVPLLRDVLPGHPAARSRSSGLAYVTPIWHGVDLCRDAHPRQRRRRSPALGHVAYLGAGPRPASSRRGARTGGGCSDDDPRRTARSTCPAAAASTCSNGT